MKRLDNPELKRRILNHLADQYQIKEVREPNHLSSYVYCRTKAFLDQKQTIEPTEQEVMLFALGYGLQDVLTPKNADTPVYQQNGIIYRPDMVFVETNLVELKTTRRSARDHYIDESLPATWLDYMKGGCYIRNTNQYDLIVLYLMGDYSPPFPAIYADTFIFDEAELEENWKNITAHKSVLDTALDTGEPPNPFVNCYSWECRWCRYKLVCETICRSKGIDIPKQE